MRKRSQRKPLIAIERLGFAPARRKAPRRPTYRRTGGPGVIWIDETTPMTEGDFALLLYRVAMRRQPDDVIRTPDHADILRFAEYAQECDEAGEALRAAIDGLTGSVQSLTDHIKAEGQS